MKINNSILQLFAFFFIFLLLSSNVYANVFIPDGTDAGASPETAQQLIIDLNPITPPSDAQDPAVEAAVKALEVANSANPDSPSSMIPAEAVEAAQAALNAALEAGASPETAQAAAEAAARVVIESANPTQALGQAAEAANIVIQEGVGNDQNTASGQSSAPKNSPDAEDNKIKGETAEEVAKKLLAEKNKVIAEETGAKRTLKQKIAIFLRETVKTLTLQNLISAIKTGSMKSIIISVVQLGLAVVSKLVPIASAIGVGLSVLSLVVSDIKNFQEAFPNGVPPIPFEKLTKQSAEIIKERLEADGNTVTVETETRHNEDTGNFETVVTGIVVTGAAEGETRSTTIDINGVPHQVTVSADGVSVSPSNPSSSSSASSSAGVGLKVLQPGWDYGSFNTQYYCGDGIVSGNEQCEQSEGFIDNPRCPQPILCDGKLTGLRPPLGMCVDCQCSNDFVQVTSWEFVVGSCGSNCNSTSCSAGQVCSNGVCSSINLCGNNVIDSSQGEECDNGNAGGISLQCSGTETCRNCRCLPFAPYCDDGLWQSADGETCDINNTLTAERSNPPNLGNIGVCRAACEDCVCTGRTSSSYVPKPGNQYIGPSAETCQTKNAGVWEVARDEDCDGLIDENIECACNVGEIRPCGEMGGVCQNGGTQECIPGNGGVGKWDVCKLSITDPPTLPPSNEICDGLDNNCNGIVDECGCANFFYFNRANWEVYDSALFIPASIASINNSMQLITDTNLTYGAQVSLAIYESDSPNANIFDTAFSQRLVNTMVNVSGDKKVRFLWNITDAVISSTSGAVSGGRADGLLNRTFFFIVNSTGQSITSSSLFVDLVNIITPVGSCNIDFISGNNKLNANGIYFVNKSIEFNQSRISESGVNVVWSIEGENEPTIIKNEKSFVMNFSRAGQKIITLNANIPGCAVQSRQVSIMVIDNTPRLFTFVNAPFYNQVFRLPDMGIDVSYRGNESYVVQSLGSVCPALPTLNCLAGNCPSSTSNVPSGCSGNSIGVNANPDSDKFAKLNFTWSKINSGSESLLTKGHGLVNTSGSINYQRALKSSAVGDKRIKLILNYTDIPNGKSLQGIFVRNFTVGTCVNGGRQRVNIDNLGRIINVSNTLTDRNACIPINGESACCPPTYSCGVSGLCEDTGSLITSCNGYTDLDSCQNDPFSASEFEYNTRVQNGLPGECNVNYRCEWRSNACAFNITQTDNLGNFGGSCLENAIPVVGSSCDNGESTKLINITSTVSGELSCLTCQSGVYEVPCGRPSVELPFFGIYQLLLSVISIAGLYLFLIRRRFKK